MRPTNRRAWIALALLLFGAGLSACGQMGPLVLPDEAVQTDADDEDTNGGDDERRD